MREGSRGRAATAPDAAGRGRRTDRARARPRRRRIRPDPRDPRPHSDLDRAGHHLGAVVRALLLQVLEDLPEGIPHRRPPRGAGPGRKRRGGRHRPRLGGGLQDGEPQPPELHRALPGRRHRSRRHPARRLHHGRAADRPARRPAFRRGRCAAHAPPDRRGGARHRRLRQLHGRAHGGRRNRLPQRLQRQHPGQRLRPRPGPPRQGLPRPRHRQRQPAALRRQPHRPRRHPRRHHGLGVVRRRKREEAADGAGGRSLHRKGAARSRASR